MPDKLVTVMEFGNPIEARIAQGMLSENDIKSYVHNESTSTTLWYVGTALGGVKLQVLESDAVRAVELLELAEQQQFSDEPIEGLDEEYADYFREPEEDETEASHFDKSESPVTPEQEDTDLLAGRALRASLIAILFVPFQLYVTYLLLLLAMSTKPLSKSGRRKALVSLLINVVAYVSFLLLLFAFP